MKAHNGFFFVGEIERFRFKVFVLHYIVLYFFFTILHVHSKK